MNEGPYGKTGKILHIDLTAKKFETLTTYDDLQAQFVGGRALAGHFLRPHCTRNWNDPAMPFIACTGALAGTPVPGAGQTTFMTRSPLTGAVGDASAGGSFATQLKQAGWDGFILTGCAAKPTGITLTNGKVDLTDATGLRGLHCPAIFSEIERTVPAGSSIACVGPSADQGSRLASIMVDRYHAASRTGIGTALATKNVKYIAVNGTEAIRIHDLEALQAVCEDVLRLTAASPVLRGQNGFSQWGTAALYDLIHSRRMMPTDNFLKTRFPHVSQLNAPALHARYHPAAHGCGGCPATCKHIATDGRLIPDFDALSHLTALIGNRDMETAMEAFDLIRSLGMDPISVAGTLACLREIKGKDYTHSSLFEAIRETATDGTLGQGSQALADAMGMPECSMSVKGLELPAYDPRGAYGLALAYAVSTRGACAMRAYPVSHEILRKPVVTDRFTFSGKARIIKTTEDTYAAADALGICRFMLLAAGLEEYAKAYAAVFGPKASGHDLQKVGECTLMNERIMNALNGFTRHDDKLPQRFFTMPGTAGGGIDIPPIDYHAFANALTAYYAVRGLDDTGMPREEELIRLGLSTSEAIQQKQDGIQ